MQKLRRLTFKDFVGDPPAQGSGYVDALLQGTQLFDDARVGRGRVGYWFRPSDVMHLTGTSMYKVQPPGEGLPAFFIAANEMINLEVESTPNTPARITVELDSPLLRFGIVGRTITSAYATRPLPLLFREMAATLVAIAASPLAHLLGVDPVAYPSDYRCVNPFIESHLHPKGLAGKVGHASCFLRTEETVMNILYDGSFTIWHKGVYLFGNARVESNYRNFVSASADLFATAAHPTVMEVNEVFRQGWTPRLAQLFGPWSDVRKPTLT